jgi:hypothetical protein
MYLNFKVYCSIFTEGKNSTSEWSGEDREVAVPGAPKARVAVTLLAFKLKALFCNNF